jgi:DNA-binding transcriptional MocR family regulator
MDTISFAGDGLAADLIPSEELADCAATALGEDGSRILSYGTGSGYTPLRELIAEQLQVHPYRVLLTNGWLQGFSLLVRQRAQGQNAIIEYPTYFGALSALFGAGANVIYADLHEDGLMLQQLADQIRMTSQKPVLAYTIPTFQNPTGQTLGYEQRWELCRILLRAGIPTVEDDTFGFLRFEGERIQTLFEMSGQATIYSTSFSYTIAPGLRVGVWVLPNDLAAELSTRANDTYITPSLLGQATIYEFMRREAFEPHLIELTANLKERRDTMVAALEKHVPDVSFVRPEGGIFLMLKLPPGTDAKGLLDRVEGVTALPGSAFGGYPHTIRLNFAEPALDEIEPGIERLAAALTLEPVAFEGYN